MRRVGAIGAAALVSVAAACGSSGGAPATTPAPATGRSPAATSAARTPAVRRGAVVYQPMRSTAYVVRRRDSVSEQLPNGLAQTQELTRTIYLTVETSAGAPMRATIVLDSLVVGGIGISQADADSARGTRWSGTLTPEGRLAGLTSDRSTAVGQQLSGMLPAFFPRLPTGGARDGAAWTDTLTDTLRAMAFNVRENAVVASRAAADSGIRIESTVTFTRSGSGSQFGQVAEVQATGTRHLTSRIRNDGVLAETTGTESSDMTITVPAVGQSLPVKQSATFSIALMPPAR